MNYLIIGAILLIGLVFVIAAFIVSKIDERNERKASQKAFQAEKKADERKESIDTGNGRDDFLATIDVLHDVSRRGK